MNFVLEIKLKRYMCLANYDGFFGGLCVHFELLLGWECTYVCRNIKTEKENTVNTQNIKQTIGIQLIFITEKYFQREHFLAKEQSLFEDLSIHFEPLLGWKFVYVCHDLKNEEYGIYDK